MPVKDELTGDPVDGGGPGSEVEVLSPESLQQPSLASWDLQTAKSPQALYTPPDINSKLCSSSNYVIFCHSKDLEALLLFLSVLGIVSGHYPMEASSLQSSAIPGGVTPADRYQA